MRRGCEGWIGVGLGKMGLVVVASGVVVVVMTMMMMMIVVVVDSNLPSQSQIDSISNHRGLGIDSMWWC